MIDIVHGRPPDSSIIPIEPEGFYEVHSRSQTRSEAENGADIPGDFGLEKGNAHVFALPPGAGHATCLTTLAATLALEAKAAPVVCPAGLGCLSADQRQLS
jgi:hypothetical protein